MKKLKLKKEKKRLLWALIFLALVILTSFILYKNFKQSFFASSIIKYTSNIDEPIILVDSNLKEKDKIYRGQEVNVYDEKIKDDNGNVYVKINYKGKNLYIDAKNLTENKDDIIKEKVLYVRTSATLYNSIDNGEILSLVKKGDELQVLGFDSVNEKGKVGVYKVQIDAKQGYVHQKYLTATKERALENYNPIKYYNVHNNRGDRFGGGHAGNLDYYPFDKPAFENNVLPSKVYALYVNSGVVKNIDAFIEFAKTTKINAFVVDIKDNESPGYKSKVFEQLSPTNYKYANNSFEGYKMAISKLKEAGFYVIGRITVFKDKYYCIDNPDKAILNTQTNEPYVHSNTFWPSPYQRDVWEFNVRLAKEAVNEMGFNEIQFDYVRFPDRTGDAEKSGVMDFRNEYQEEKAQAIQSFLMYAVDEIHKLNAYVSVDVFGESAYTYVTAYGQYWPAMSNIVDVISGMPYPDHFNKYEFDFKVPVWTVPYDLLKKWGSYVVERQSEIPTPAVVRTWIQVYDAKDGYEYGVNQIDEEIRGLIDAGLTGGYMTWLSYSSLDRYKSQKEIYDKEY